MKSLLRSVVRARGLEPPRAFAQRDLNPPRLPVPPRPRWFKDRARRRERLPGDDGGSQDLANDQRGTDGYRRHLDVP